MADVDCERKFEGFDEFKTAVHGPRGNHGEMGALRTLLAEKGLEHVFTCIFAIGANG